NAAVLDFHRGALEINSVILKGKIKIDVFDLMLKPIHFETRILDREMSSKTRHPPGFQVSIRRQGSLDASGCWRDGARQQSLGQGSECHRGHLHHQGKRPLSFQRETPFHQEAERRNLKEDSVQTHALWGYEVQGEFCIARDPP